MLLFCGHPRRYFVNWVWEFYLFSFYSRPNNDYIVFGGSISSSVSMFALFSVELHSYRFSSWLFGLESNMFLGWIGRGARDISDQDQNWLRSKKKIELRPRSAFFQEIWMLGSEYVLSGSRVRLVSERSSGRKCLLQQFRAWFWLVKFVRLGSGWNVTFIGYGRDLNWQIFFRDSDHFGCLD